MRKPDYLGDSVYVDFDGFHLILTTNNGEGPANTIYLEDTVFLTLKRYGNACFGIKDNFVEASSEEEFEK